MSPQFLETLVANNLLSAGWFKPELALTFGSMAILVYDLVTRRRPNRVPALAVATLVVLAVTAIMLWYQQPGATSLFNGMIASDGFATFFKWIFVAAAALTVVIAAQGRELAPERMGEFFALLLAITLGMFLMASATNLLMIYMAVELVSMVSYVLAGYRKADRKAHEAALKYVIYGGVASGVMLFGMSYLYGLLGTADVMQFAPRLAELSRRFADGAQPGAEAATKLALVLATVFVSAGIGYKVAAVPWHMWCPDVYEGAPTPFTAFLSVGPKAAGFALAIRFFFGAFAGPAHGNGLSDSVAGIPWPAVVGVISAATMTLGNLVAIVQTNLKRLLAYSSIAHAGYMLMGLAAVSLTGMQSVMIYSAIYLVMNLGAFLVVIVIAQATGSESIFEYKGLARRHPLAAVAFAIFLFSLTGLPPFAGFMGKLYLFYALFERIGVPGGGWYAVLALVGALNTAVSLYYYARIIRAMFLDPPYEEAAPVRASVGSQVLLGAFSTFILVFGVWWNPIVNWSARSLELYR
ncbi:MAG TPA: NADH-quinone oxidoreductase subunit N [Anaeromyxobacteraceae bacterium]|nr:NADH-quinone oxidoreductase subunit N [Anaeromyxobacteraceae bacterium]